MHNLYFVVVPKTEEVKTANDAITEAEDWLNQNDFASEGGFYAGSKADWFQMGGRWSGLLSQLTWAKKAHEEIDALEKEHDIQLIGCHYSDAKKTKLQTELLKQAEEIWQKYKPDNLNVTYNRTMYDHQEDDAMLLTDGLLEALQARYPKKEEGDVWGDVEFVDIEEFYEEPVYKLESNPNKWIVVVDYHS